MLVPQPNTPRVRLVTVATQDNDFLQNWLKSAERAGHRDMVVLGMGETWGGWSWRSKTLSDYFAGQVGQDTLFVCLDAYDMFVLGSPSEFEEALTSNCDQNLKIGIEFHCFTIAPCKYTFNSRLGETFPNGGCVAGTAKALADLYGKLIEYPDDQVGIGDLLKKKEVFICPDAEYRLVFNVTFPYNKPIPTSFHGEAAHRVWHLYMMPWYTNRNRNQIYVESNRLYVKNDHGKWVKPAAVHIPGSKNDFYTRYNYFARQLNLTVVEGIEPILLASIAWTILLTVLVTIIIAGKIVSVTSF
jgi:hypothetical protein